MADDLLADLAPPTESEAKFDAHAAWDADSGDHAPVEAGNDAHEAVAAIETSEPEAPAPIETLEEPVRNESGQFVKKGKGKPRSDPQARVEAATAREAEAKRLEAEARQEAAALKARIAALEARPAVPSVPPQAAPVASAAAPDFPGFDDWAKQHPGQEWDAYIRDLTRHEAQQTARREASEQFKTWQDRQTQQAQLQVYEQRMTEGRARYQDWQQVLDSARQVTDNLLARHGMTAFPFVMEAALIQSTNPADILHDLALHPEDAVQLAVESKDLPVSAAPMLRRILESRLAPVAAPSPDSAPPAPISTARPPINRVGGSASATPVDPDDLDFSPEYIRLENERERKARAGGRW